MDETSASACGLGIVDGHSDSVNDGAAVAEVHWNAVAFADQGDDFAVACVAWDDDDYYDVVGVPTVAAVGGALETVNTMARWRDSRGHVPSRHIPLAGSHEAVDH